MQYNNLARYDVLAALHSTCAIVTSPTAGVGANGATCRKAVRNVATMASNASPWALTLAASICWGTAIASPLCVGWVGGWGVEVPTAANSSEKDTLTCTHTAFSQ